jgi:hypothetical protein
MSTRVWTSNEHSRISFYNAGNSKISTPRHASGRERSASPDVSNTMSNTDIHSFSRPFLPAPMPNASPTICLVTQAFLPRARERRHRKRCTPRAPAGKLRPFGERAPFGPPEHRPMLPGPVRETRGLIRRAAPRASFGLGSPLGNASCRHRMREGQTHGGFAPSHRPDRATGEASRSAGSTNDWRTTAANRGQRRNPPDRMS